MGKMLDPKCNVEFPTEASYLLHKKANHKGGLERAVPIETPPTPTPPPGVPVEALPSPELMEQIQRLEAAKNPPEEESKPSEHPSEMPPSIPLVLKYIWTGEHDTCRRQPSTLELEVSGKFFTVAYCDSCKKQLESKEVAKL